MILLEGRDWESINKKARVDVLDIVVNLDGRYTPVEQANLIVKRCDLTAKAQAEKILIKLQAIYNIPDLGAENVRMGEFIQELMSELELENEKLTRALKENQLLFN